MSSPALESDDPAGAHPDGWRAWLADQGEWGAVVEGHDWAQTALGPIQDWPSELQNTVSLCVAASIPMAVWWGPELVVVPNAAAREVFGTERFDTALGRSIAEVWPDALPRIRSEMAELSASGKAFFVQNSLAPYDREVPGQETYLTYSYTPVVDPDGHVAGVVCIFIDTTEQNLSRRRSLVISGLNQLLGAATSPEAVFTETVALLADNSADHPCAAILHLGDGQEISILACRGFTEQRATVLNLADQAVVSGQPVHAAASDGRQVAGWHAYPLVGVPSADDTLVLMLAHHSQRPFDAELDGYFASIAAALSGTLSALRDRDAAQAAREQAQLSHLTWRAAVLEAMHDPLVIFDHTGTVIELNQAFTNLLGYDLNAGPIRPPYPWWPTAADDAAALSEITALHQSLLEQPRNVDAEMCFYARDRHPVWVETLGSYVINDTQGAVLHIRTLHDVTRNRNAQRRRATAASLSADFGTFEDLETLLGVAEYAYAQLFDGTTTIQLDITQDQYAGNGDTRTAAELDPAVRAGIAGTRNPDTKQRRPGILLTHQGVAITAKAWIQFPRPRQISADEMIVADLLAQAFAYAVDRIHVATKAAERHHDLQIAMESHRLIGQAVGILVERHRILPSHAFDRLKTASQNRNQKLRDIAARMIETGAEPDEA